MWKIFLPHRRVLCKKPQTLTHILLFITTSTTGDDDDQRNDDDCECGKLYTFFPSIVPSHSLTQILYIIWWPTNTVTNHHHRGEWEKIVVVRWGKIEAHDDKNKKRRRNESQQVWKSLLYFFHHAKNNYFVLMQKTTHKSCSFLLAFIYTRTSLV